MADFETHFETRFSNAVSPEEFEFLLEEVSYSFFKEEDVIEKTNLLGLIQKICSALAVYYNPCCDEYAEGDDDFGWDSK